MATKPFTVDGNIVVDEATLSNSTNSLVLPAGSIITGGGTVLDATNSDTDDLTEGVTNLYFTDTRADARIALQAGSNLDLSSKSTTDLSEGTNLYYTDTRADARIALQAGANLDLSSKSTTDLAEGTNLYYTNVRADARITAASIIDLSDADQSVQTTDNVTFANITATGYLAGPASFVIDPAAVGDDTGTVVIAGNLQVDGLQTTINSTTVSIDDLNFSIATDAADSAAANGAGITVGGAGATLNYTHATTSWDMNKPLNVTGDIGVTGTVDGVDIQTLNTTAGAALPKAGGTMTGDLSLEDNTKIQLGTSNDLEIYHDGSNSYIHDRGVGNLYVKANVFRVYNSAETEIMANFVQNSAVSLYHDATKKFETTATGINVTGDIGVTGTVDGVDIAARDAILTSTTTTAGAALPKAGGTMTGNLTAPNIIATGDMFISSTSPKLKLTDTDTADEYTELQNSNGNTIIDTRNGTENGQFIIRGLGGGTVDEFGRFDELGRFGVGSSNPDHLLHVGNVLNSLGTTAGDSLSNFRIQSDTSHNDSLLFTTQRLADGTGWTTAAQRIQRNVDTTLMGYMEFGHNIDALITFGKGSTERVRIDGAGNVGIGETSPAGKLEVQNTSVNYAILGTSNKGHYFESQSDDNTDGFEIYQQHGSTASRNSFIVNDNRTGSKSAAFAVRGDGKVGIGVTNPRSFLDVKINTNRSLNVRQSADTPAGTGLASIDPVSGNMRDMSIEGEEVHLSTGGSGGSSTISRLTVLAGGNVGIGTESPEVKLEVNGGADGSVVFAGRSDGGNGNNRRFNLIAYADGGGANYGGGLKIQTRSSTNVFADAITVQSNGNVGIGNINPNKPLTITSDSGANTLGLRARSADDYSFIQFFNHAGTALRGQIYSKAAGDIGFTTGTDSSAGNDLYIKNGTGVGIGTSAPGRKLDVQGTGNVYGRFMSTNATGAGINVKDSAEDWLIQADGGVGPGLAFYDLGRSAYRLIINSSGNVGIGITDPSAKLHTRETTSDTISAATAGVKFDGSGADGLAFGNMASSPYSSWIQAGYLADGYNPAFNNGYPISLNPVGGNVGIGITNPSERLHVSGNILATGVVNASSDISLKDNITPIPNAIDKVLQIRGVTFNRNDIEDNPRQAGVIAQEVEKVLPEVVSEDKDGIKSVAYGNMVSLLIEAIKEQQEQINMLKEKLENK